MAYKRLLTTVATAVTFAAWCRGQTQVPPGVRVEVTRPPTPTGDLPAVNTSGQIPNFGGVLQGFANVHNVSLWRPSDVSGTKAPFGGEVVMPLARRRLEMFGGIGGVYSSMGTSYTRPYTWLTQVKLGGRVALDPGRHVWLGTTAWYHTNFAEKTRQWMSGTADLSIRFGR